MKKVRVEFELSNKKAKSVRANLDDLNRARLIEVTIWGIDNEGLNWFYPIEPIHNPTIEVEE